MAAEGRTRVRLSVASQFFHNDDTDTLVASGEYSVEDSTSEKVSRSKRSFPPKEIHHTAAVLWTAVLSSLKACRAVQFTVKLERLFASNLLFFHGW